MGLSGGLLYKRLSLNFPQFTPSPGSRGDFLLQQTILPLPSTIAMGPSVELSLHRYHDLGSQNSEQNKPFLHSESGSKERQEDFKVQRISKFALRLDLLEMPEKLLS